MRLLAATMALALAAPALADDPGVFKIPGTESTIKFYGYVQLDSTLDLRGRVNGYEPNDWATILPAVPTDGSNYAKNASPQLYFTARTSRFGLQTSTPSDYGTIGVKLEGDFNAPNGNQGETYTNSVIFRIRQAYGTIGGLLVGQTWSNFLDLGAYPDVVDFNGPGTIALVRNPGVKYTFGFGNGIGLALSVENAAASRNGAAGTNADPFKFQTVPDFIANLGFSGGWGHVSLRGVVQTYNYAGAGGGAPFSTEKSLTTFGGAASGDVKIAGDTLVWQVVGGPGIGRYMFNAMGHDFVFPKNPATGDYDLDSWTMYGVHAGYTHVWNKMFRSNLVLSYSWFVDPKIAGASATAGTAAAPNQQDYLQGFLNTFWSVTKTTELGVEYALGQWRSFSGASTPGGPDKFTGTESRVNASMHYNFY
jgi:hypothetical protein